MEQLLYKLRISSELTKKQLAEHLNIPINMITQLEKQPLPERYFNLLKLANYFHIQVDSLLHNCSILQAYTHYELVQIYQSLDDRSKGILFARAYALVNESSHKKKENSQAKWECH